jgi:hypothetical protein
MHRSLFVVCLLLFSSGDKHREAAPTPQVSVLSASSSAELEIPMFAAFGQPRSDENGNIYFHAATRSFNDSYLIAISAKTGQPKFFVLPDEYAKNTYFESFSVTPSGGVYVVAEANDHSNIIFEFDSDGKLSRHAVLELPEGTGVETFAAFEDGNFFVLGCHRSDSATGKKGSPFLGLFDNSGRLLRSLDKSGIPKTKNLGETAETAKPSELWTSIGDDGNLYLLTSTKILVINESGGIVRRLTFQKPGKDNFYAVRLEVSGGLAAIWLHDEKGPGDTVRLQLELLDANTGKIVGIYSPATGLGANAVSFSRNEGFVFLVSQVDGNIGLITASLK